jgi:hypothetical protein
VHNILRFHGDCELNTIALRFVSCGQLQYKQDITETRLHVQSGGKNKWDEENEIKKKGRTNERKSPTKDVRDTCLLKRDAV